MRLASGNPAHRFIGMAMLSLVTVGVLAPRAFPMLTGSFYDRSLLAFVHLNTLGVIAAAMIAATFQIAPCALSVELNAGRRAPLMFWLHLSGIAVFLLGFHQTWHPVLATGGLLLAIGLGLYIQVVVQALRRAPVLDITSWHLAVGQVGLAAGVLLGFLLAGSKGTWFLGDITLQVLSAHAVLMLGGWVLLMVNGVAYHMLPKLSGAGWQPRPAVAFTQLALVASGAWLTAGSLLFAVGRFWVTLGACLIVASELLFLAQIVSWHVPDFRANLNARTLFVLTVALSGFAAAALLSGGLLAGEPLASPFWVAAGWLVIGGVALAAIQGLAPVIGSEITGLPLIHSQRWQQRLAIAGWLGWTASLIVVSWAVLSSNDEMARLGGFLAAFGVGCFGINFVTALISAVFPDFSLRAVRRTGYGRRGSTAGSV